ncbi:cuticle protein 2-like [Condylostylus longicornis]|uniref:cuticle protein 2-like n=1 Tax=Condylostylus longicornis TaxID=2530218 RepID=UPI00244D9B90|nr:cuticle protein 2-like [Condylostylus longicornis]
MVLKIILSVMLFGLISADVSHLTRGSHYGDTKHLFSHTGHSAHPMTGDAYARILRNDYVNDGHGTYNFAYETDNGIRHNEDGAPDNSKRGEYSFTGDDGKTYTVMYWADENGFHAVGDHLPGSQNSGGLKAGPRVSKIPQPPKPSFSHASSPAGGNYNYPKPSSGYNYAAPKTAYLPPKPAAPKTNYLPPKPAAPKTNYLPPKPSTDYLPPRH